MIHIFSVVTVFFSFVIVSVVAAQLYIALWRIATPLACPQLVNCEEAVVIVVVPPVTLIHIF
jgi:hypothetical protein